MNLSKLYADKLNVWFDFWNSKCIDVSMDLARLSTAFITESRIYLWIGGVKSLHVHAEENYHRIARKV